MYPSKIRTATVLAATAAATLAAAGTAGAADARPLSLPVQVVSPGQVVDTGHGVDLQLNRTDRCVGAPDAVSLQTEGDASGTVYAPLYIGPVLPTRMTVTVRGRSYPVQLVTLSGHPGYATGYVVGPPPPAPGDFPELTVQVYDARGTVMASFVSPGSAPSSSSSSSSPGAGR